MVRNMPMERWLTGAPTPDHPLYDVEERDDALGLPTRVLAIGVTAATGLRIITRELLLDAELAA